LESVAVLKNIAFCGQVVDFCLVAIYLSQWMPDLLANYPNLVIEFGVFLNVTASPPG
jgi:hypothetical protein